MNRTSAAARKFDSIPRLVEVPEHGAAGESAGSSLLVRAELWTKAAHASLAPILSSGRRGGVAFVAHASCEGPSISDALSVGPFASEDVVEIAIEIAGALASLHAVGGSCLDLSPGSVYAHREGDRWNVRLAALGVSAVHSETRARATSQATDLYLLGALISEMTRTRERTTAPRPDRVPALGRIGAKLSHPRPERRYRSAASARTDLLETLRRFKGQDYAQDFELDSRADAAFFAESFVGREDSIEVLQCGLEKCRRGQFSAVLLLGSTGSGRTALLREFGELAAESGTALGFGGFDERARCIPWQGLRAAVAEAGVSFEPLAGSSRRFDRAVFFERLGLRLAQASSAERPLVILVDDLHAADPGVFEALECLAGGATGAFVLLVGSFGVNSAEEAASARAQWERMATRGAAVDFVELRDFTVRETHSLLEASRGFGPGGTPAGLGSLLHAKTNGNPAALCRALRLASLSGQESPDQSGAIEKGLSVDVRAFLVQSATIGRTMPFDCVARAFSTSLNDARVCLNEALRAGILRERSGSFSFVDPEVRARLLSSVDDAQKMECRARAAKVMIALNVLNSTNGIYTVAELLTTSLTEQAADQLEAAGDMAMLEQDSEAARTLYLEAVRAARESGRTKASAIELRAKLAEVAFASGRLDEARAAFEAILESARSRTEETRWRLRIADCLQREGNYADSEPVLRRALEVLQAPALEEVSQLAAFFDRIRAPFVRRYRMAYPLSSEKAASLQFEMDCLVRLWTAHAFHDGRPLMRIASRLLVVAASLREPRGMAIAHQRLSLTCLNSKRPHLSMAFWHAKRIQRFASLANDRSLESNGFTRMAAISLWRGQAKQSLKFAENAVAMIDGARDYQDAGHALYFLAAARRACGDLAGTVSVADRLAEHGARHGAAALESSGHARAADALALLGRFSEAEERAERAIALVSRKDVGFDLFQARKAKGGVLLVQGRYAEARAPLQGALRLLESKGRLFNRVYAAEARLGWCEAALLDSTDHSEDDKIRELIDLACRDERFYGGRSEVDRVEGLFLAQRGRLRAAKRTLARAANTFDRQGRPLEAATTLMNAGLALQSKLPQESAALLRDAFDRAEKMGAHGISAQCARAFAGADQIARLLDPSSKRDPAQIAAAVISISRAGSSALDEIEQARAILDRANELLQSRKAQLFLSLEGGEPAFVLGREAPGADFRRAEPYAATLVPRAVGANGAISLRDDEDGAHELAVLAAPIRLGGRIAGVLCVDRTLDGKPFNADDSVLAALVADQIGSTVQLSRLARETAHFKQSEKETELALAAHAILLPEEDSIAFDGATVAAYHRPAAISGGDWWQFEEITPRRFRVCVGDVTGQGAPAALVAALMVGEIGGAVENGRSSVDFDAAIERAGQRLHRVGRDLHWMTMTAVEVDLDAMAATFWFASSPPVFLTSVGDRKPQALVEAGLPLGHQSIKIGRHTAQLKRGDRLLLFTDGAMEQRMPGEMEIGLRRLQGIFKKAAERDALGARNQIALELEELRGPRKQDDDITFVVIEIA